MLNAMRNVRYQMCRKAAISSFINVVTILLQSSITIVFRILANPLYNDRIFHHALPYINFFFIYWITGRTNWHDPHEVVLRQTNVLSEEIDKVTHTTKTVSTWHQHLQTISRILWKINSSLLYLKISVYFAVK